MGCGANEAQTLPGTPFGAFGLVSRLLALTRRRRLANWSQRPTSTWRRLRTLPTLTWVRSKFFVDGMDFYLRMHASTWTTLLSSSRRALASWGRKWRRVTRLSRIGIPVSGVTSIALQVLPTTSLATAAGMIDVDFGDLVGSGCGPVSKACLPSMAAGDVGDCFYNFSLDMVSSWFWKDDVETAGDLRCMGFEVDNIFDDASRTYLTPRMTSRCRCSLPSGALYLAVVLCLPGPSTLPRRSWLTRLLLEGASGRTASSATSSPHHDRQGHSGSGVLRRQREHHRARAFTGQ